MFLHDCCPEIETRGASSGVKRLAGVIGFYEPTALRGWTQMAPSFLGAADILSSTKAVSLKITPIKRTVNPAARIANFLSAPAQNLLRKVVADASQMLLARQLSTYVGEYPDDYLQQ